jgi:hypothetical protein
MLFFPALATGGDQVVALDDAVVVPDLEALLFLPFLLPVGLLLVLRHAFCGPSSRQAVDLRVDVARRALQVLQLLRREVVALPGVGAVVDVVAASSIRVEVPEVDRLRGRLDLLLDDEGFAMFIALPNIERTPPISFCRMFCGWAGLPSLSTSTSATRGLTGIGPFRTPEPMRAASSITLRVLPRGTAPRSASPRSWFRLLRFFLRLVEDLLGLLARPGHHLVRSPGSRSAAGDLGLHRGRDLALRMSTRSGSASVQSPRSGRRSAAACPKSRRSIAVRPRDVREDGAARRLFGSADACPGGFVLQAFECSFRFASSMPW